VLIDMKRPGVGGVGGGAGTFLRLRSFRIGEGKKALKLGGNQRKKVRGEITRVRKYECWGTLHPDRESVTRSLWELKEK